MQVNRVPILIALVTESVAALYCYLLFKCLFWLPLYAILYTFPMSRAERLFRLLFNSGYIPYGGWKAILLVGWSAIFVLNAAKWWLIEYLRRDGKKKLAYGLVIAFVLLLAAVTPLRLPFL
jgi:hypothetical protein